MAQRAAYRTAARIWDVGRELGQRAACPIRSQCEDCSTRRAGSQWAGPRRPNGICSPTRGADSAPGSDRWSCPERRPGNPAVCALRAARGRCLALAWVTPSPPTRRSLETSTRCGRACPVRRRRNKRRLGRQPRRSPRVEVRAESDPKTRVRASPLPATRAGSARGRNHRRGDRRSNRQFNKRCRRNRSGNKVRPGPPSGPATTALIFPSSSAHWSSSSASRRSLHGGPLIERRCRVRRARSTTSASISLAATRTAPLQSSWTGVPRSANSTRRWRSRRTGSSCSPSSFRSSSPPAPSKRFESRSAARSTLAPSLAAVAACRMCERPTDCRPIRWLSRVAGWFIGGLPASF